MAKRRAVLCCLAAAALMLIGYAGTAALYRYLFPSRPDTLTYYSLNAVNETLVFALPALLFLYARAARWADFCALRRGLSLTAVSFCLLCAVGAAIAASLLAAVWASWLESALGYTAQPNELPLPHTPAQWAMALLSVSLVPAAAEELFFRALIQRGLDKRLPRAGVWLASLLFACAHLELASLPAIFMIGAVLGFLMRRRGIYCAMLFHALYNAVVLVLSAGGVRISLPMMLLCTAAFVFSLRMLIKKEASLCD